MTPALLAVSSWPVRPQLSGGEELPHVAVTLMYDRKISTQQTTPNTGVDKWPCSTLNYPIALVSTGTVGIALCLQYLAIAPFI